MTVELISTFVFATQKEQSLYFQKLKLKPLAIFCSCTAQFLSYLVRDPEDRFSHDTAQIVLRMCYMLNRDYINPADSGSADLSAEKMPDFSSFFHRPTKIKL